MQNDVSGTKKWPLWRKIGFRFFCIFFTLNLAPWSWLELPGINYISDLYYNCLDWSVNRANSIFFHVREELVPINGSGDTSFAWAQLQLFLLLSAVGCIVWSIADMKRASYEKADYWLRTFIRYYLVMVSLSYGCSKLFALQMPYPTLSAMATPVGDLLPMRLSWMFFGYSTTYQMFGGVIEICVGLLLLSRPMVTLGLLLGSAVFFNVFMLNVGYDIPVKLYSLFYVFCCAYLLLYEAKRLILFFLYNKPAMPTNSYHLRLPEKWMRISKVVLKCMLVIQFVIGPLVQSYAEYSDQQAKAPAVPFDGIYDVTRFVVNGDTAYASAADTLVWKDIIFQTTWNGNSIGTGDTLFNRRYGRGYFDFTADTSAHTLSMYKTTPEEDTISICNLNYEAGREGCIKLWTVLHNDSLYMEMKKSSRHFQLSENQFHWLSEDNR